MIAVAVIRADSTLVPRGGTQLQPNDIVLLAVENQEEGAALATAWARGGLRDASG